MRVLPIDSYRSLKTTFKSENNDKKTIANNATSPITTENNNKNKKLVIATAALAATSVGLSIYALTKHNGNASKIEESASKLKDELKNGLSEEISNGIKKVEDKVSEITTKINSQEQKITQNQIWNDGYLKSLENKIEAATNHNIEIKPNLGFDKNWKLYDGMRLRQNTDNDGVRKPLSQQVVQKLREVPMKYISGKDSMNRAIAVAALGASASIWLPSAETKPEKEGGLGEVPVQMAANFIKEYGIEETYIPRPLIEIDGKSSITKKGDKWIYKYNNLEMEVDKIVEYDTMAYHDGMPKRESVEVFYGIDPESGYKRLMFKNSDYFRAPSLYEGTVTGEEKERYTFFSRALYDFIKLIKDPSSMPSAKIEHPNTFKSIKAPDTMVLNDWHVAPIAALARALAPVEAANQRLNAKAAEDFENMNMMYIVHNADYQGSEKQHRDDILNTLFGDFTYDIVSNAQTGFYREYRDDNDQRHVEPISDLRSPFMIKDEVNMANMAMSYANTVKPVSATYAKEIGEQDVRGKGILHIAKERLKFNTMAGQSNGWDRSVNEVSQAQIKGFNNNLNKDKFVIVKHTVENIPDLSAKDKAKIKEIYTDVDNKVNYDNFEEIVAKLDRLNIPALDEALKDLKAKGVLKLRSFERANCDLPQEELFAARKHNKQMLLEHIQTMVEYDRTHENKLFNIQDVDNLNILSLDPEKLDEVPFFNMGVRFVDQKGVDIISGAMYELFTHWDEWYPGKQKPIFNIGGVDPTADGKFKNMISGTKKALGEKGNTIVQWVGFVPNNILMAGSDWTLRPSHFEPDGDKWESLYKGTPMVMTRVGGHIDSIKDNHNGFLTRRTVPEIEAEVKARGVSDDKIANEILNEKIKDYVESLRKALDLFYDRPKYEAMVKNAIDGNQSWVMKDADGKIISCPSLEHLRDLGFNLKEFPQVSETAYERK